MAEIVGAFLGTELWDKGADCSVEGWNSSRTHFAHECFEFAVSHLDWIEVWRVLRQVANCRPRLLNRLSTTGNQVNPAVIHDDDVIAPERGNQALLDIGEEHLTGHGALDHHWRGHFIVAQGGHESDRLPCSKRKVPITRTPRGVRPLSRTMLVLTAVSSINTSRAGSSMPCSRIQRRRARATSARCRSAACRRFFKGEYVPSDNRRKSELVAA